jgi:hypothetical protein
MDERQAEQAQQQEAGIDMEMAKQAGQFAQLDQQQAQMEQQQQ